MSYKKERSMKLQDKVKRLLAANAVLRETIKAKDKAIVELIDERHNLNNEVETLKSNLDKNNRFIALMCLKCAYKQDDKAKDDELDRLKSDIDKMKCCGNCGNTEFDGGMGSCCKFDDLRCEGFSYWVIRR